MDLEEANSEEIKDDQRTHAVNKGSFDLNINTQGFDL